MQFGKASEMCPSECFSVLADVVTLLEKTNGSESYCLFMEVYLTEINTFCKLLKHIVIDCALCALNLFFFCLNDCKLFLLQIG